jgi:hypothetical protein
MRKKKQEVKIPILRTILYVFDNGEIVSGSPTTIQLIQDGDNIQAMNIISRDGDKFTYSPITTFLNVKLEKVEPKSTPPESPA